MLLKNISKDNMNEWFPRYGVVKIASGEVKEIPDEVAALWMDPSRNIVRVEVYQEPQEEEPPVKEDEPIPVVEEEPVVKGKNKRRVNISE